MVIIVFYDLFSLHILVWMHLCICDICTTDIHVMVWKFFKIPMYMYWWPAVLSIWMFGKAKFKRKIRTSFEKNTLISLYRMMTTYFSSFPFEVFLFGSMTSLYPPPFTSPFFCTCYLAIIMMHFETASYTKGIKLLKVSKVLNYLALHKFQRCCYILGKDNALPLAVMT